MRSQSLCAVLASRQERSFEHFYFYLGATSFGVEVEDEDKVQ